MPAAFRPARNRVRPPRGHAASDSHGCTALIAASRAGRAESVRALIRLGADPDRRGGVNDWTPVMHAIHKAQPGAERL